MEGVPRSDSETKCSSMDCSETALQDEVVRCMDVAGKDGVEGVRVAWTNVTPSAIHTTTIYIRDTFRRHVRRAIIDTMDAQALESLKGAHVALVLRAEDAFRSAMGLKILEALASVQCCILVGTHGVLDVLLQPNQDGDQNDAAVFNVRALFPFAPSSSTQAWLRSLPIKRLRPARPGLDVNGYAVLSRHASTMAKYGDVQGVMRWRVTTPFPVSLPHDYVEPGVYWTQTGPCQFEFLVHLQHGAVKMVGGLGKFCNGKPKCLHNAVGGVDILVVASDPDALLARCTSEPEARTQGVGAARLCDLIDVASKSYRAKPVKCKGCGTHYKSLRPVNVPHMVMRSGHQRAHKMALSTSGLLRGCETVQHGAIVKTHPELAPWADKWVLVIQAARVCDHLEHDDAIQIPSGTVAWAESGVPDDASPNITAAREIDEEAGLPHLPPSAFQCVHTYTKTSGRTQRVMLLDMDMLEGE